MTRSAAADSRAEHTIWLALWAAGTVLAAEDRWLVEPSGSNPKCPYEINGRPAQVSKSVVEGVSLPVALCRRARKGLSRLDGWPALRKRFRSSA